MSFLKTMDCHTVRSDQRGQVSLFVALVFQVLFIFFAMVVNLGMLVHQKINLQNSTDLAAYYGAMKQAEMLNAVAHINYQIRQAYKLIMFRYLQLGMAGEKNKHPYQFADKRFRTTDDTEVAFEPSFCITYAPVSSVGPDESYCKNLAGVEIPLPGDPALSSVSKFFFLSLAQTMDTLSKQMLSKAQAGCRSLSVLNWLVLAEFINIYKMDLINRRKTLLTVANAASLSNPLDLEGESVQTGVYKTLYKNLTSQNKESLSSVYKLTGENADNKKSDQTYFQFINGLNLGDCGPKAKEVETPGWLSDVFIYPVFRFLDASCDGMTAVKFYSEYINTHPLSQNVPRNRAADISEVVMDNLRHLMFEPGTGDAQALLEKSSLGYEKNPWCMAYVGVRAATSPIIPFSPFGSVRLEARSFAKPFGGRIGPWYGSVWPVASNQSMGKQTDLLVAMRRQLGSFKFELNDPNWKAYEHNNFSRYAGDQVGFRSNLTTGQMGRAIHNMKIINLNWWKDPFSADGQLGFKESYNDPLAWDSGPGLPPQTMRNMEIAAIAPDQFDNTYYSIEPDYYNNYLKKLRSGYGQNLYFRGDLGSREKATDSSLARFSIRDQIKTAVENIAGIDVRGALTYQLENPFELLTAFQSKNSEEHVLDETRFGKCLTEIKSGNSKENNFTPGACAVGGRAGYSVKFINSALFASELELGGEGIKGRVKNPPPENFLE